MAGKPPDRLIRTEAQRAEISRIRGCDEITRAGSLVPHVGQRTAAACVGRSQSWVSRNLNGGLGKQRNREYMQQKRELMKTQPKMEPEVAIRMLAERLAVELKPTISEAADTIAKAIRELPGEYFHYKSEREMFGS